ncbi:hypothetical protein V5O48_016657 [Marasmius crinis-equi]|uniref:Uncharacterized protein n=1 Tax=Marasmius crinis-equi TaxID=585013 RepID=A0ABR3ER45_9AGAR
MSKKKVQQPPQEFVQGSSLSQIPIQNPSPPIQIPPSTNHPLAGLDREYSMGSMLTGRQWAEQVQDAFEGIWEDIDPQLGQCWDDTEDLRSRYQTLRALQRDLRESLERLLMWFAAIIDQVDDSDLGADVFPKSFHPFLPNRPSFIEVFSMNPEVVSMYGLGPETNQWNMLKSENEENIRTLRLDPQQPGGSSETAIGYETENETNPNSDQNSRFPQLVTPRPRDAPPPEHIDLRRNPFDVAHIRAIAIPFGMEYPPRFDIMIESRYYVLESGHFLSLRFARRLFRLAIKYMNSYSTECNAERAHWWWEEVLSTRPTRRCELCVRRDLYCGPKKEKGKVTLISCGVCNRSRECCSHRIRLLSRMLSEATRRFNPVNEQDIFLLCRQWKLILKSDSKGMFRLALTKNSHHLIQGFEDQADALQPNVNEYVEFRTRAEVKRRGMHDVEYWTQQYKDSDGERYRRLVGDEDNRADRGEPESDPPYDGVGDEEEAEKNRKVKGKSREKLKGIRIEKAVRVSKKKKTAAPLPSKSSTSRVARAQQVVVSSGDEEDLPASTSRPKITPKLPIPASSSNGKGFTASVSRSVGQTSSDTMMPRATPPYMTVQPRRISRTALPLPNPEDERPTRDTLSRISHSLRRDTPVRMGEGEGQPTERRVRRRPQRIDRVEIPPPPSELVAALRAASQQEEHPRGGTPLFLPSESPTPKIEENGNMFGSSKSELQYPDNQAVDKPGPSSRAPTVPVTPPPVLVDPAMVSLPFHRDPEMPLPSVMYRSSSVQATPADYRDSSIQTLPMVLPPQVTAMRERQFELERDLLAARAEIDHLRGEYQLSQDSLRETRQQLNVTRQPPSHEFLGTDGVHIQPGDIPQVISIANRAQNAAAGPILGILSAMAGNHRSDFMRWEQEVSDGQRSPHSFAQCVLEHSRSLQDFLLQAETAYDSVMSATDRRDGLNFLRAHGSRVPHAIRRMWQYTGPQWTTSMVARSEGIISENTPSEKVLGKRKPNDDDCRGEGPDHDP